MIRIYDATEKMFDHNGIKAIQPLFAEITKADNSDYYIELEDVLGNAEYYQKGVIVRVPTPWGEQGFRCDNPIIQNNRISCKAWHLSYDSKNYVVNSATATEMNCEDALNHYNANTDSKTPFNVISDISTTKTTVMEKVSLFDVFSALIGTDNYGGHWYRDNFTFGIMTRIGEDRGVVLAYNKNITDIKVSENWDNVCTRLLPYVKDGDTTITLDNLYIELDENPYDVPYTKVVEFKYESKEGEGNAPTTIDAWKEWLYTQAVNYLEINRLPQVNYSVSAKLDNVSDVGDSIIVKHPLTVKRNVEIPTEVISVKYDVIRGRYTAIEFGNFKKEVKHLTKEVASVARTESKKGVDEVVPDWAKSPTKPSYNKSEVGLGNVDNVKQYSADNPPPYPVISVNGKTGSVQLSASDVGADESGSATFAVFGHNIDTEAHADIRKEISTLSTEKVDKKSITLGLHTDGKMYVFIDGKPVGDGITLPSNE